jgi:cytochrome P450
MELSINRSEAVDALYRGDSCAKGPWYDLGGTGQNLHRTRNRDLHDLQKPFWQQGLNDKGSLHASYIRFSILISSTALEAYIGRIRAAVATLLENIDAHTEPVDMNAEFQAFAFKLMSTITFSLDFPVEGIEGAREALNLLDRSQTLLSTFGHVPWVYAIAKYIPRLLRSNAQFSNLANRLVERRREINPDIPDLFSHLLKAEHNPNAAGFPLSWEARLAIVVGRCVASRRDECSFLLFRMDIVI